MEPTGAQLEERPRRRLSPVVLAVGATVLLVLILLGSALGSKPALPPQVGQPVPTVRLSSFDGKSMEVPGRQGKVVVLNFFASWCDPCRREAADLELTWREYQGRGVQFLGIGYKDAASKAKAFVDEFGITYPSTADTGNRTARAYGVTGVPETFVIDASGRLVRRFLGPLGKEELRQELDRLLAP